MTHPPSCDDRSSLDEALFSGDLAPRADVGTLPEEPPVEPLPSPLDWVPESSPEDDPSRRCHDGDTEYRLAGVAPGLYEMRAVPASAGEHEAEPEDEPAYEYDEPNEEPARAEEPAPPRPPCTLQANQPLEALAGETTPLGREHLRLAGPDAHLIDVMLLSPAECGAILRDGFALTGGDVFTQEDVDQGKICYRHDGGDTTADRFTFATPDGEVPPTVFTLVVRPVRRCPELAGPGRLAGALDGLVVREILDGQARCHEGGAEAGLVAVALAGRGAWQFSRDGGATWADFGEVHHGRALPLGPRDALRFVPRPGWSGTAKLTYRAWDGSQGEAGAPLNLAARDAVGGATAFSRQTASASLVLPPPVPAPAAPPWRGELTVGELFGEGAAVVRLEGPGLWEYTTDGGATWREFGGVYHGRARLLGPADRVRFVRRRGASGKVILSARAWDGRGPAGATANVASRSSYGEATPYGEFVQTRTWRLSEE